MDDSIQTLKAEMNKLMSVYDDVKLKPDQASLAPAPDNSVDQILPSEVLRNRDGKVEQRPNTMITEAGREVLEVNFIKYDFYRIELK